MSAEETTAEDYRSTVKDMLDDLKKGKVKVDKDIQGEGKKRKRGDNGEGNGKKKKEEEVEHKEEQEEKEKEDGKDNKENEEEKMEDNVKEEVEDNIKEEEVEDNIKEEEVEDKLKEEEQNEEQENKEEDEALDNEVSDIMGSGEDEEDEVKEADQAKSGSTSSGEIVSVSSNESEKKDQPEVVDLSGDEDKEEDKGDPDKDPEECVTGVVDPAYLVPFRFGWKREVAKRQSNKNVTQYDVYYHPPQDTQYRTREAKRKRRSKADQEKYFEDFPSEVLSVANFNYMRKPLGINNAAYEIIRTAEARGKVDQGEEKTATVSGKNKRRVNYKEVEESAGLVSSDDEDDTDLLIEFKEGFDMEMPISLQGMSNLAGMRAEHKKRRKVRDPETCCTPPLAEEMLWAELDEDPMGVYNNLGGRSSPSTPPPLRAVKLTPNDTAEKIKGAFEEIKNIAAKFDGEGVPQEPVLTEDLASHDISIKKFKHFTSHSWHPSVSSGYQNRLKSYPGISFSVQQRQQQQQRGLLGQHLLRKANLLQSSNNRLIPGGTNNMVRVKLPMQSVNGKRPVVELVMEQNGKYRPVKFSNNMQVTESIPEVLFEQANALRRPVYQKATQVPRIGGNRIYLAVNPSTSSLLNGLVKNRFPGSVRPQQPRPTPAASTTAVPSDQVAILVKPQKGGKAVLLNVPRKVAVKVKPGTTLSFSASSDQKYTVVDSKIHPPVGKVTNRPSPAASLQSSRLGQRLPLPAGLTRVNPRSVPFSRKINLNAPTQLTSSVSIRPLGKPQPSFSRQSNLAGNAVKGGTGSLARNRSHNQAEAKGKVARRVLATGEVIGQQTTVTPCTPYCPGVSGFPELECNGCKSLFHSKCVGISQNTVSKISSTFRCKMCAVKAPPQVIDLE